MVGLKFPIFPFFSENGGINSQRKPKLNVTLSRDVPFVLRKDREVL